MEYVQKRNLKIFFLLLPSLLFFLIYVFFPALSSILLTFFSWDGLTKFRFVGFGNWTKMLQDHDFHIALRNSFIIFVGIFGIMIPSAFAMAVLLNQKLRGTNFYKFIYFAPIVVSSIMIGLVWSFILDPTYGLLNNVLGSIGLDFLALQWIGGRDLSPYSIAFICIWQWWGINIFILTAGIKSVPSSIFEAAELDGASGFYKATRVTLPLIKEQLLMSAVLNVVGALKVYEIIIGLTGGGPGYSSEVLGSYMMVKTFTEAQFGYGATISGVISILSVILSIILIRFNNKETYEF